MVYKGQILIGNLTSRNVFGLLGLLLFFVVMIVLFHPCKKLFSVILVILFLISGPVWGHVSELENGVILLCLNGRVDGSIKIFGYINKFG